MRPRLHYLLVLALLPACIGGKDQPQFTLWKRPIIGGSIDTAHTSVVALTYSGQQFCTGTVISTRAVLTAGHCLEESGIPPTQMKIFFGQTVGSGGQLISVTEGHAHPNYYTRSDGAPMYDVAVLLLAQDAPVAPMAWQQTSLSSSVVGKTVTLVGYGVTNAYSQTGNGTRRVVDQSVDDLDSDFIYYSGNNDGTCQGDSGGPMFLDVNGTPTVIGVTSFGDSSCVKLGANTRTDIHAAFISQYAGSSVQPAQPVAVSFSAPTNGATLDSSSFAVSVVATSPAGVKQVDLYIDGTLYGSLSNSPYNFQPTGIADGSHQLNAKAQGLDGGTGEATIQVTVAATATGCSDTNPCHTGYDCINGQCVPQQSSGCSDQNPCATGFDCINGQCVPQQSSGCDATNPCAVGFDCVNGQCVPETPPPAGSTGAPCTANTDCTSGICVDANTGNGYCSQQCTSDHECPNDAACFAFDGLSLCGPPHSATSMDAASPTEVGSGCQAGGQAGGPVGAVLLGLVGLALAGRRRARR